jgi:hypothetical protein
MVNAYIIWFTNSTYTEAYGEDEESALRNYLNNIVTSVREVVPADIYTLPLPVHLYIASPPGSQWPEHEPVAVVPLYHPSQWTKK